MMMMMLPTEKGNRPYNIDCSVEGKAKEGGETGCRVRGETMMKITLLEWVVVVSTINRGIH